jgi:hypothetical protein
MNSSLQKALVASMLLVGGAVSAIGQGFDYDPNCQDLNNTAPYSTGYISYYLQTPLWCAGLGVTGTSTWNECVPGSTSGGAVPVSGRFEFGPGSQGSIQDNLRVAAGEYDVSPDDLEDFQYGANHGQDPADRFTGGEFVGSTSGSGWSFARIQVQGATDILFGGNAFSVAYVGISNRYFTATQISGKTTINLQVDIVGDCSRFAWSITNGDTKPASYGLEVGQWIVPVGGYLQNISDLNFGQYGPVDNYGQDLGYINPQGDFQPYILLPGYKPLTADQAFIRSQSTTTFPAYADITGGEFNDDSNGNLTFPLTQKISPQLSGGEQIVNSPYQNVEDETGYSDQTPVDEFDVGDVEFLLDGDGLVTNPTFGNVLFSDAAFGQGASFAQKWYYAATPAGGTDTIISYYRSVWGDSNYFNGYAGVVDTPKTLAADLTTTAYNLNPNPFHVIVDVDNTGVFGFNYQEARFGSTEVDLNLPQGMYPAGGNPTQTTMKQFISSINPVTIGSTDFLVQADPSLFGPYTYTVVIKPPAPIASKTIQGTINVAATPRIKLNQGANLITEPWNFPTNASWDAVLNLAAESGFQSYTWDPLVQEYILQSNPARGIGTWIVANNPPTVPFNLGSTPLLPTDEFPPALGAPSVTLQPGWNLVGNPYNYSFPLGQLVGVLSGSTEFYSTLVANGTIDGSFAYYDPSAQTYSFLGLPTDELLPNYGYWVYASTTLQLSFPPVFDLFDRVHVNNTFTNYVDHWKLQLSASATGCQDLNNFVGVDTIPGEAAKLLSRKPPIAATSSARPDAIRAFLTTGAAGYSGNRSTAVGEGVVQKGSARTIFPEYAQMVYNTPGKDVFNFNVFPTISGNVTVSWPNLSSLPKNLSVQIKDVKTNQVVDARSVTKLTVSASALVTRTFQVTITPEGTIREAISGVTTLVQKVGPTKKMIIGFTSSSEGVASLYVYQNGKAIATIATDQMIALGKNSSVWNLALANGQGIKPGTYTLAIVATGDGGDTTTKYQSITL